MDGSFKQSEIETLCSQISHHILPDFINFLLSVGFIHYILIMLCQCHIFSPSRVSSVTLSWAQIIEAIDMQLREWTIAATGQSAGNHRRGSQHARTLYCLCPLAKLYRMWLCLYLVHVKSMVLWRKLILADYWNIGILNAKNKRKG